MKYNILKSFNLSGGLGYYYDMAYDLDDDEEAVFYNNKKENIFHQFFFISSRSLFL
ncbi:MAG: hypothetical protein HC906_18160 [Bacteroidales bacterium]|nr:hypothetical protein [Bacteroidales bacterium]